MGSATKRLSLRRDARRDLDTIYKQPNLANVIHYSCESFYERSDGSSPRITSIAVRNIGSGQTTSFSIHQIAERKHICSTKIDQNYDDLEREMLDDFFSYIKGNLNHNWIHWNIRDINYGFPVLEHRYQVLGGDPISIDDSRLYDLAHKLVDIYGPKYVGHPRLTNILKVNRIEPKDFLDGKGEADAFEHKEYVKLHQSTLRKVDVIHNLANREWDGTLKTCANWREEYGTSLAGLVEIVTDHWLDKGIGALAILVGLICFFF